MVDPEGSRKLTAILAADVAGYSRLMQVDDRATVAALGASRGVRFRIGVNLGEVISKADSTVYGDGVNRKCSSIYG